MDCQTAIEYINLHVDNMLGDADTERLFEHIRSCGHCREELDKTLMLKKALSGLDELEPPAGLALSAIKKAKKRKIPVFAYASAAVAAVITLFAVFSSGLFPNNYGNLTGSPVAFEKSMAQDIQVPAPDSLAPMAVAPAATSAPGESLIMGAASGEDGNETRTESAGGAALSVTVPAASAAGFREALDAFIEKYGIETGQADDSVISFVIPEGGVSELQTLINDAQIPYDGELAAGSRVQITFE